MWRWTSATGSTSSAATSPRSWSPELSRSRGEMRRQHMLLGTLDAALPQLDHPVTLVARLRRRPGTEQMGKPDGGRVVVPLVDVAMKHREARAGEHLEELSTVHQPVQRLVLATVMRQR